jgi:hypothetical protein
MASKKTVSEQQQDVSALEKQLHAARTADVTPDKLAQPGHKEPEVHPVFKGIRIWEPEAWNAHLANLQAQRGEEKNIDCPRGLNKLHTITDKPIDRKDPTKGHTLNRSLPKGPTPGADAICEPFDG